MSHDHKASEAITSLTPVTLSNTSFILKTSSAGKFRPPYIENAFLRVCKKYGKSYGIVFTSLKFNTLYSKKNSQIQCFMLCWLTGWHFFHFWTKIIPKFSSWRMQFFGSWKILFYLIISRAYTTRLNIGTQFQHLKFSGPNSHSGGTTQCLFSFINRFHFYVHVL